MEIIWHGQSCFTIKGSSATLVTDPYSAANGLTPPKFKADIVTVSHAHENHNNVAGVEGENVKVFDWPGEYESKEVMITCLEISRFLKPEEKTDLKRSQLLVTHIEMDGIKICHLGGLEKRLTGEMIEAIGDVDVLLLPVGGGDMIGAKTAHEVIEQVEPRIVIPMHYKIDGLKEAIEPLDVFIKEMGIHVEPTEKWGIKNRKEMPEETTGYVILMPQLG
ncbi:MAG: MBL fold metallo-hydrolase [Candidatus Gracilibacteria bacterium]